MRPRLTYANVVATLALFVALGGSAYAATQLRKNSVGTKQLKNEAVTAQKIKKGTITGSQIDVGALGTVPSATSAVNSTSAAHATTATHAESATSATHADSAASASTAEAIKPPEALHLVGEPGEPTFASDWNNFGAGLAPVSFYKDREGVVHLQGLASATTGATDLVFTLPAGDAPAAEEYFPAVGNGGAYANVHVKKSGEVDSSDLGLIHLNGITWRAGQ